MFILRLDKFSKENDPAELSGVSFSTVSALCGAWVGVDYMRERGVIGDAASSVAASWNDFIQVRDRESERDRGGVWTGAREDGETETGVG
jgi:hypothetical protein